MSSHLDDLYQEVILDHSRNPRNYHKLEGATRIIEGNNPLCGDQVTVYIKMEGDRIADVTFQGSGCAISKAAASLMTANLKGKTRAEARHLFEEYLRMVTTGKVDPDMSQKLIAFAGVHQFPARVKCAILPWRAVLNALGDDAPAAPVSTE